MATLVTDNFDSYSDGNLPTQGNWVDATNGNNYQVQGTVVAQGAKAVKITIGNGESTIDNTAGAGVTDGSQVFYMRKSDTTHGQGEIVVVKDDSGTFVTVWEVGIDSTATGGNNTDIILAYTNGTILETLLAGISANTWYEIEMNWRSSDHKVRARARVKDAALGTWSAFYAYQNSSTANPKKFRFDCFGNDAVNTVDVYFDALDETAIPSTSSSITQSNLLMMGVG